MRSPTIIAAVLGLLVAVGCKDQGPPKPMDCSVIPPAIDRIMADHSKDPRVAAVIDQHKTEMVGLCTRDEWSNAMGVCIAKAKNRGEMDNCRGIRDEKLEHLKAANARLRGLLEEHKIRAAEAEAAKAAAAGSGTGSGTGAGTGTGSGSGK
jgi:hypothetical protein